jgi:hypothetical protein
MSEYDAGNDYGDADQVHAEFTDGSSLTLVDVNGDGVAEAVIYDADGDGVPDGYADESGGYATTPNSEYPSTPNSETYEPGYADPGYTEPGYTEPASMYTNGYIDTAVSSNPGGEEFYINLGDGQFYSQA